MVRLKVQLTGKSMIKSNGMLEEYIKLIVESKVREAHLTGGRTVAWGAPDHLTDLEKQIAEIQQRKSRHPRGSAARADYSKVEARLRAELKSAQRHASTQAIISEKENE
jgi:hypothetical protein